MLRLLRKCTGGAGGARAGMEVALPCCFPPSGPASREVPAHLSGRAVAGVAPQTAALLNRSTADRRRRVHSESVGRAGSEAGATEWRSGGAGKTCFTTAPLRKVPRMARRAGRGAGRAWTASWTARWTRGEGLSPNNPHPFNDPKAKLAMVASQRAAPSPRPAMRNKYYIPPRGCLPCLALPAGAAPPGTRRTRRPRALRIAVAVAGAALRERVA